jgi:hypothetical protein
VYSEFTGKYHPGWGGSFEIIYGIKNINREKKKSNVKERGKKKK